eukprot:2986733-Pleurochrysis_carterae.AAC.4
MRLDAGERAEVAQHADAGREARGAAGGRLLLRETQPAHHHQLGAAQRERGVAQLRQPEHAAQLSSELALAQTLVRLQAVLRRLEARRGLVQRLLAQNGNKNACARIASGRDRMSESVFVCTCVYVRACVRACVCVCVRASVRA